ncbi:MAG: tetratricopeptide repeat-containing protein, partial [Hyphomicrobiales bacterium]
MRERASDEPVRRLEELGERGAFLEAADFAKRLLRQYAIDSLELGDALANYDFTALTYHHVWAVARSGATARALQLFAEYRLGERRDRKTEGLYARILKDRALKTVSSRKAEALTRAAEAYGSVHEHHGGHWPAVNAATLHLLGGSADKACAWAETAIGECVSETPASELDAYFRSVSMAEASLVIGDAETATRELWRAGTYGSVGYATRATTRKQLRLVCHENRLDPDILTLIDVPMVIYYAGHIISPPDTGGRFPADQEPYVAERIAGYLDKRDIGFAFGSLAAGADILFAEACLERDIDLHVVLPFDDDEFIET